MKNTHPVSKKVLAAIISLSILSLSGILCSFFLAHKLLAFSVPAVVPPVQNTDQLEAEARRQAEEAFLNDMRSRLVGGTGISSLLREYYPDHIVYAEDGRYIFADIDLSLKMNRFSKGAFHTLETGEITYSENNKVVSHKGIDVSRYQGTVDFSKVRSAGVEYAMIRCGYRSYGSGVLTEDSTFKANIENALSNQLDVGVYFFTQAVTTDEAKEEADYVLSLIRPYNIRYPVVLDVEEIYNDTYRQENLSKEELTDVVITFCDQIKNAGYTPMIYGNLKCFIGMLDLQRLENYEKWFAYYGEEPYFPYEISMWQYTDTGTIDGISGNVDFNISFKKW